MTKPISTPLKTSASQILASLAHICRKAGAHAEATGVAEEVFLNARLYPDMFAMVRQVQIATDIVRRGACRLAGVTPDPLADDDVTFASLVARCETALADVLAQADDALDAGAQEMINVPMRSGEMQMSKQDFLLRFVLPNLIFHASMAYGLLRHQGVPLAKMDFLNEGKAPG